MSISLDKFRAKLFIKVLYARSSAEAERFINAAVAAMKRKKIDEHTITDIIDRLINQFSFLQSSKTDSPHWNNIIVATFSLQRMRDLLGGGTIA